MLKRLSQYLCILLIFVLANIFLNYQIGNLGYLSINLLLIFVFARYISTGYFIFLFALSQFISSFYSSIDIVGCVAVLITIIVGLIYAIFQKSFKNKYIYLVLFSILYFLLMIGKDAVFFGFDIIMVSIKYHIIETFVNFVLAVLFTYLLDKKK